MLSLPLLIGVLSVGNCQKLMIIESCLLEVAQMIEGGGAQEKTDRGQRRIQHGTSVQRPDCELVVFIFAGGEGQIEVGVG